MHGFARQVLTHYRDADHARYLGTLFRLQLAAGQYPQAIASIHALRSLRSDAAGQPPMFLQYEIHARAKQRQASGRTTYADAWQQAFAERFGALDDRTALQAEFAFGGWLPRMRDELDAQIANARDKPHLSLDDAIALIRAWQVHDAYATFQPHFANALAADDARRYAIDRDA